MPLLPITKDEVNMNLQRHQKGFTLLEILIAMGIVGIIIMVMGSVFIGATKLWLSSDVHMQAQQSARDLLSGDPHLKVKKGTESVTWQGILNELQDMCILLPANPGGTPTLASNKIRFATEAYIQDGGDGACDSAPSSIWYSGESISDIQIGTTGVRSIFIIHGKDGKFRSTPGDNLYPRETDPGQIVEVAGTDDILYGRIICGPDGTISTVVRTGSNDIRTSSSAIGSILINPGIDNRLQSILGDNNGDGDLLDTGDEKNPDEYIAGDVISYEFGTSTITRRVNDANDTTKTIIGTNISDFSLSYYDAANSPTTDLSSVKQIAGTLTVAIAKKAGSEYATYTITFKVNPRKLDSAFGGM
ncbi:MAG: prepilin-type N-terminal cleavage/methylation domain-containing protein [Candidatus Desantisbacteria bacterium]